ncbi:MAG TPA: hypothetical protein VGF02_13255 [Pseudolabrys sp.]
MTTKGKYLYGFAIQYDDGTQEFVGTSAAIDFSDDFVGAGHTASLPTFGSPVAGYPWVQKTVKTSGSPSVAAVANGAGGLMQLALTATSESQEATLYQNDQRTWDSTKTLIYQTRAQFATLPSAAGVQAVFGLAGAWASGPLNIAQYIYFGLNGSGELFMYSYDGTTAKAVDTGIAVTAGTNYQFRIEIDQSSVLHFYVNGTEYTTSLAPITWAASGVGAILQLYQSVYKPNGTGLATLVIDSVEIWSPRT